MSLAGCPNFSSEEAINLVRERYGLSGRVRSLPSERDQNFHLREASGEEFVLKIANADESREALDCQNQAVAHLAGCSAAEFIPRVCRSLDNEEIVTIEDGAGTAHLVRLLTYLPGEILAVVPAHEPVLLRELGSLLGCLDEGLAGFAHPAAERHSQWDLRNAAAVIRDNMDHIGDPVDRELVQRYLNRFEEHVLPTLGELRTGVIHNDGNDWNVLVGSRDPQHARVIGIVDFGDMVRTCTVFELAVGAAYAMLDKRDPLAAAAAVASGYHDVRPLTEQELTALFPAICARLAVSVSISAARRREGVADDYHAVSEKAGWQVLRTLDDVHPNLARVVFCQACGEPPCPRGQRVVGWIRDHPQEIGPVVDPPLNEDNVLVFDLGVGSLELPSSVDGCGVEFFTDLLFGRMRAAGKQVGIGQYDEPRRFYSSELFRPAAGEIRTVHIGMDLFLEAGAPVRVPLDGTVHSFADNSAPGDYGPCIILQHEVEAGELVFFTLYGHLSPASLEGLEVGATVSRGDRIAWIGNYPRNGNWPPHLHFQLIVDMLGKRGDFPGVAAQSQRQAWLGLCPDPNVLLGIPAGLFPRRGRTVDKLVAARRESLGSSLSISYGRPLKIVRGAGQYLYDDAGRQYLDLVNNVCHVGHCQPKVVEAASQQMAVLNTNTRYLHDNLVDYARRLCSTMPDPLSVCFLVCSGSEANELALRMARAHTGGTDFAVVDGAYHGNTAALVDISPYKFAGPGGAGVPEHVHVVGRPDVYRGEFRDGATAGVNYGGQVAGAVERARDRAKRDSARARGIAAFICESALGCGGQIILPNGYLKAAYKRAREAGAVCIADEVQVGFGRVGTHLWCFETQGVVPDIVTLGKPMGNGHPLAGVVTTPEIAASFANGMEYFNSTGGNPVSCAVGLAVLDVIEEEALQRNALEVGARILRGLQELAERHPLIGDVRGLGLFIGLELVTDRATRQPAAAEATYIVEGMKERGILLSIDGPLHNTIKIKPPLVVTAQDAKQLVGELDQVLGELTAAGA